MIIKLGLPPNIEAIKKVFTDIAPRAVFTYGNTIYIQDNKIESIPHHIVVHEETHALQQGDDPEGWWDRYLTDMEFRLDQEIGAYGQQYKWLYERTLNKFAKEALSALAEDLSGPMYGNVISFGEAESKIRNAAKNAVI